MVGAMKYGKAIRVVRTARGVTQKGLAERASLDQSHISMIERGVREPSVATLEAVSVALGVPLYLLILLASETEDLKGISEEQAGVIGRQLLEIVVHASEIQG